ncbi:MAG: LysM peptidoglycan-binding domain-containing protein [Halioglobus sp.]|nr:LysM peptidoglycan-binding domain-containing protein [Halioglobus sp.]
MLVLLAACETPLPQVGAGDAGAATVVQPDIPAGATPDVDTATVPEPPAEPPAVAEEPGGAPAAKVPVPAVTAAPAAPSKPAKTAAAATPAQPDAASPPDQPSDLWERIRQDLRWQETQSVRIDKAREGYLRHSTHVPEVAGRADHYLYYIVEEVQKRNMPVEIALIPMLESDWDPFAASPSGAAGLWQIMPATGAHLGLEQDSWYDGRVALRDSTTVALDYLESLYEQFDRDWFLALAAYNSGAGNVERARKANEAKGLGTDYWSLKLPRQATNYVPKLIALSQIVAEPERFDVEIPEVQNAPSFEVVETGGLLQMSRAAELAGVDLDTLRALNPGQLRETILPGRPLEMLVPVGSADRFEYNIAKLSPEELVQWKTYRIKPGDSLNLIAQKFDIEVEILQDINSIEGSTIQAGEVLKIPDTGIGELLAAGEHPPQGYMVREGDSLYRIAGKFKVSVDDIIAWNSLDPKAHLKPGQELKLYVKGG